MDKIVIGGGYKEGLVDLDKLFVQNIKDLVEVKGVVLNEIIVCILDCLCYFGIIEEVRGLGISIYLILDGDIVGVIYIIDLFIGIDIYMGQGGVLEGVFVVVVLCCIGG